VRSMGVTVAMGASSRRSDRVLAVTVCEGRFGPG
jgi:hypothetical protein